MIEWATLADQAQVVGVALAAGIAAAQGIRWLVQRRRGSKRAATPRCLRDLSAEGRRLLTHIHSRSLTYFERDRLCPNNDPNNTNEASIAKGAALHDLDERSLLAVSGTKSTPTFRALVKDLEGSGLIEVVTDDVFRATHLFISDLGLAVLNKKLPPELRPASA
ncbi:MAG: hypothetical protein ACRD26_10825 [Vicinamibacterales bacterium]